MAGFILGTIATGAGGIFMNKQLEKIKDKQHSKAYALFYDSFEFNNEVTNTIDRLIMKNDDYSQTGSEKTNVIYSDSIPLPCDSYSHLYYENYKGWEKSTYDNCFEDNPHVIFWKVGKEIKDGLKIYNYIMYFRKIYKDFADEMKTTILYDKSDMVVTTKIEKICAGYNRNIKISITPVKAHQFQKNACKYLIKEFMKSPNKYISVLIHGLRGCGKTKIAHILAHEIKKKIKSGNNNLKINRINIYDNFNPSEKGLRLESCIFENTSDDLLNIIFIDEFDKVISRIGEQNSQYHGDQIAYTDNKKEFLTMMNLLNDMPNLIVLYASERPQEDYAYKLINGKWDDEGDYSSFFRDGRITHSLKIIRNGISRRDMHKNKLVIEGINDWKHRWIKKTIHRRYKKKTSRESFKETLKKIKIKLKNIEEMNRPNIFFNIYHFLIKFLFTLLIQIIYTSYLLLKDIVWTFTGRDRIFIKNDMSYEFKKINNRNNTIYFYNNIKNNKIQYRLEINPSLKKYKMIFICYYFSLLTNYYKNTYKIYLNKEIKLKNYEMIYK